MTPTQPRQQHQAALSVCLNFLESPHSFLLGWVSNHPPMKKQIHHGKASTRRCIHDLELLVMFHFGYSGHGNLERNWSLDPTSDPPGLL